VGNGNPNCQESDKGAKRSLFHGLARIILQSMKNAGEIQIEALKQSGSGQKSLSTKMTIKSKQDSLFSSLS
jgi:beta-galactosidase